MPNTEIDKKAIRTLSIDFVKSIQPRYIISITFRQRTTIRLSFIYVDI